MAPVPEFFYTVFGFLIGYVVGSFPTAFLLLKWKKRIDVRHAGSGNVGAMNAFETSGSKGLGIAVLLIDVCKGAVSIALSSRVIGVGDWTIIAAGIGTILGHNYSPWLKFRGGRGLAPTAGVMLVVGWVAVPLWCLLWSLVFAPTKQIHLANIVASVFAPIVFFFLAVDTLSPRAITISDPNSVRLLFATLCLLILVRHKDQFTEISRFLNSRPS